MDDLIAQLGDLNCHLNPPCTLEQLRFIPAALACDLDSAMLALYTNHNGMTDQRLYFACCAMNLLPLSETDQLFPFAHDEDMWIQERACELLGLRRVASAVPTLADIVRTGTPNGQTAALGALGKIGTDEAQKQLLSLARETIPGLKLYVAAALQACGYEMKRAGEQWQYRAPQSERWQLL